MLRVWHFLRPLVSCPALSCPVWLSGECQGPGDGIVASSIRRLSDAARSGDSEWQAGGAAAAQEAAPEGQSDDAQLPKEVSAVYQERFIPFDKNVLHHMLLKELSSVTETESESLTKLVEAAEADTMEHYHAVLEQLMALFEPINPDRDTLPDLILDDPVQLDQEIILLDNLGPILDQANFNRLSEEIIQRALSYHDPLFKSQVTVRVKNYKYMMFWALGVRLGAPPREMKEKIQSSKGWFYRSKVTAPMHRRYCKRVIMAARLTDGRLALRSFKDMPLENLEHLLPAVQMRITLTDRTFLYFTLLGGGSALFANLTVLGFYSLKVDFLLLLLLFALLMGQRRHRLFKDKRDRSALDHANMLFTKSTSNNGELLVSVVRRAQQEHIKEMMLAHTFRLLLYQLPDTRPDQSEEMAALLSSKVSAWLKERSGLLILFNGSRALEHLCSFERRLSQR